MSEHKANIRVLVVDDHQVFRDAIVTKLGQERDLQVVGEVSNGADALALVSALRPDVVLLDLSLDGMNGIEVARIVPRTSTAKILILSMHGDLETVGSAMAAGVFGYVRKQEAYAEVVAAIRTVAAGERYFSPALGINPDDVSTSQTTGDDVGILSKREIEIVTLVAKGLTTRNIAEMMGVTQKTVETHRHNVNKKLDTKNSADITRFAIRTGLISPY